VSESRETPPQRDEPQKPKPRINALLLLDTDAKGADGGDLGVAQDEELLRTLLQKQLPSDQLDLRVLKGAECTKAAVLAHYTSIAPGETQALFCYYEGRGGYVEEENEAFLDLSHGERLPRKELFAAMKEKRPQMLVLITDSCSYGIERTYFPERFTGNALSDLLLKHEGVADISSSANGRKGFAGIFTPTFLWLCVEGLDAEQPTVTWENFFAALRDEVMKYYGTESDRTKNEFMQKQDTQEPTAEQGLPVPKEASVDASNSATVNVRVPSDAKLYYAGGTSLSTAPLRTFVLRNLTPNRTHNVSFTAQLERANQVLTSEREIQVRAGERVFLDFGEIDARNAARSVSRTPAPAQIAVQLPSGAKLYVQGTAFPLSSGAGLIETPPLFSGKQYYYRLRAEYARGGKRYREERQLTLVAGKHSVIHFGDLSRARPLTEGSTDPGPSASAVAQVPWGPKLHVNGVVAEPSRGHWPADASQMHRGRNYLSMPRSDSPVSGSANQFALGRQ
jgi:uncharacterized protein (TIGR03000 family)